MQNNINFPHEPKVSVQCLTLTERACKWIVLKKGDVKLVFCFPVSKHLSQCFYHESSSFNLNRSSNTSKGEKAVRLKDCWKEKENFSPSSHPSCWPSPSRPEHFQSLQRQSRAQLFLPRTMAGICTRVQYLVQAEQEQSCAFRLQPLPATHFQTLPPHFCYTPRYQCCCSPCQPHPPLSQSLFQQLPENFGSPCWKTQGSCQAGSLMSRSWTYTFSLKYLRYTLHWKTYTPRQHARSKPDTQKLISR